MELAFETRALRDLCESEDEAKEKLGGKVAAALMRRLSDLQAVNSITDLPVVQPIEQPKVLTFSLPDGWVIRVASAHSNGPWQSKGHIDWRKVRRLKVLEIEKCND